jgi:hypothetical protein
MEGSGRKGDSGGLLQALSDPAFAAGLLSGIAVIRLGWENGRIKAQAVRPCTLSVQTVKKLSQKSKSK